jgi:LacI family transcriptional regulator
MPVARRAFTPPHQKRVLLMLGYYEHRMHLGVARYARQANWILDTTMAHYGRPPDCRQCDGVLALVLPDHRELARALRGLRVPIVDLIADVPGIATARVLLDNAAMGRMAAAHLLERGFRNLAFCKCTDYTDVRDREAGCASAAAQAGIDCHRLDWYAAAKRHPRLEMIAWLAERLQSLPKPLGVVAQSDHRAVKIINACELAGLAVPEQVAVVGIDNDEYTCEFAPVPITSIDSNREEYAYRGAQLLDRLIQGQTPPPEPILVPPRGLIVRRSSDILAVADPEVAKALSFIWRHFGDRITVDHVVAVTAMSRSSLYRAFENHLGHTMREEIERKRIEHAQKLLATSSDKVSHVARQCGFASGEQFCRAFARATGVTPREFRKDKGQTPATGRVRRQPS